MMRVLLAFDKFKDALSAGEVCAVATEALASVAPGVEVDALPLTDGGDGFVEILVGAAGGECRTVSVCGPRFLPVATAYGRVPLSHVPPAVREACGLPDRGVLAVVEMAGASGLGHLPPALRDPFVTTSYGTGETLLAAARAGADALLLGVGGSATHDLGLGALAALGLRPGGGPGGAGGHPAEPFLPKNWERIGSLVAGDLFHLPPVRIACDVENPLSGPDGAAAVFAPQKGAPPETIAKLEAATERMGRLLCRTFGISEDLMHEPGSGAAGGMAFGLGVACGAQRQAGYSLVAEWLGLRERLCAADLVLTGEGRFDGASLRGKGPGRVAREAAALGKPVVVLVGAVDLSPEELASLRTAGIRCRAITPDGMPLPAALANTASLLGQAVRDIGVEA